MAEELARKKRVRAGHKASATKMITKAEEMLARAEAPDPLALKQFGMSLREKLDVIKALDGEILERVEETELADEIDQADLYKEKIYTMLIKIDGITAAVTAPPRARETVPATPSAGPPSHKVRLPKLTIKPFNGNVTAWTTFWDSYKSTIHENRDLSDIEKFTYLRSLLSHAAAEAIAGLSLTAANYNEAIQILSKRYGNKQQIVNKHMELLLRVDVVASQHDVKGLRRLYDTVESNVRNLKSVGVKSENYGALLSSVLMSKLPSELKLIVSREIGDEEEWKLDSLMKVLENEVRARERSSSMEHKEPRKPPKEHATGAALLSGGSILPTCCFCGQEHPSRDCPTVVDVESRRQALRRSGRCYICLRKNHIARKCRSNIKCTVCDRRHHVAVCDAGSKSSTASSSSSSNQPRSGLNPEAAAYTPPTVTEPTSPTVPVTKSLCTYENNHVLLQTASTMAFNPDDPSNTQRARLVLDTGSQRSYITDDLRTRLALVANGEQVMNIMTFGATRGERRTCKRVRVGLKLKDGHDMTLTFYSVPTICEPIVTHSVTDYREMFPYLRGLDLADETESTSEIEVDILIGSDHYWDLITGKLRRGHAGPTAIQTKLGWVLSGPLPISGQTNLSHGLATHTLRVDGQMSEDENLDETIKAFWELESFGIPTTDRSLYDEFCDKVKLREGRYEVSLPWKIPQQDLPNNYELSLKRLRGLLRRLQHDKDILEEYDTIIKTQLQQGIVEVVKEPTRADATGVHYLPHHAVIRRDKKTTKLRIVYDASAKSGGPSLNDCLHAGPKFDQKILDLLLRFRLHRVAIMADIEKAFLMVSIAQDDREFLRFLWVDDPFKSDPEIVAYRFTRVVFGVSPSPFLLNATVRHHLELHAETHPELVMKMLRSMYVDDVVTGTTTEEQAYELYIGAKEILASAGFNLRKFTTNVSSLQARVVSAESSDFSDPVEIEETFSQATLGSVQTPRDGEQRVLGVNWNVNSDQLVFNFEKIAEVAGELEPTKRNVISLIGKFYDPIGILSPIVVKFKIFMQALCESRIEWDETLPESLLSQWKKLVDGLMESQTMTIPRCYLDGVQEIVSYKLCGYCDASLSAYAAVVYLLIETGSGSYMRFVVAKTRVAPLKKQSIPRLELLSAVLLARLMTTVSSSLETEISIVSQLCFSDSQVALYWIRGLEKSWKPFVQNRVTEIRSLIPVNGWRHISGFKNPADIPSRGAAPLELSVNVLWRDGPGLPIFEVPVLEESPEAMPPECVEELRASEKKTYGLMTTETANLIRIEHFSSLTRLIGVVTRVMKFCSALGRRIHPTGFDGDERMAAELLLIKDAQSALKKNKKFGQWERQLTLFTDKDEVLRCRGRIGNAESVSYGAKYPILLPSDHPLTVLYIKTAHFRVFHNGVKDTLTELRSRFWIIKGRSTVKQVLYDCYICRRHEGKSYRVPPPPPLPAFRLQEAPPFSHTGVDFAGPLFVKLAGESQRKVWIVLYTCCVTRAIHLDLVPDMTVSTFIRSFKRFSARRGLPAMMLSDNGKTFKAAAKIIHEVVANEDVKQYLEGLGIEWKFNVPKAPWWGGVFERLVQSTKRCLRKSLGQAKLTYDELLTAVTEVEFVLNSRPLTYIASDDLEEPLTPSHLLTGRRLMSLPDNIATGSQEEDEHSHLNHRMRYLNRTIDTFWKRWRREYLLELRDTHRYHRSSGSPQFSEGDIVVIYDEKQPRSRWSLGKIERVIVGVDGEKRAAVVRVCKKGRVVTLHRPIQHLYPLEVAAKAELESDKNVSDNDEDAAIDEPDVNTKGVPEQSTSEPNVRRPKRSAAEQARDRILAQALSGWEN